MISLEEYFHDLFKTACGWIPQWGENGILDANINNLEIAIEGRVEFVKKTNPWGKSKEDEEAEKLKETEMNPEKAAEQLLTMVVRRKGKQGKKTR